MENIVCPYSMGFHNNVYREYIRQKYNKYCHQHLRRPQSVILQKIIHEWTNLSAGEKRKLFQQYSLRNQGTIDDSLDEGEVQSKKELLIKKRQRKKTTAFKKKKFKQEQVSDCEVKDNQTQYNKEKPQPIQQIILPKQQQTILNSITIQATSILQSISQIVRQEQKDKRQDQKLNQICINTSFSSFNQSLNLEQSSHINNNKYALQYKQAKPCGEQMMVISKGECVKSIEEEKKTDEQQRWQKQIDQNSIKKLLSLTVSFQQPNSLEIKPPKTVKQNPYLLFYKQKFSEIKECFPQLTAIEITKVIKDLWKEEKQQMKALKKREEKGNKKTKKKTIYPKQQLEIVKEISRVVNQQQNLIDKQMQEFLKERPEDFPEDIWYQLKKNPLKFINVGKKIST